MKQLFLIAILASVCIFTSCDKADQQEATPATPTTEISNDVPADPGRGGNPAISTRACGGSQCECTITTDANAGLTICGDVPLSTSTCSFCGGTNNGTGFTADFVSGVGRTICVTQSGAVCITNLGGSTVTVTVQFGSSTPSAVSIDPNQTYCWYTNADCTATNEHCP
jgi:hypothetical protein